MNATSSPGNFTVSGSHTYATTSTTGSYAVTVMITDPSGQTATANSTALVATPIAATGTTFDVTPGIPLPVSTVVAKFSDANPIAIAQPSLIAAVINWGDGQTSQGIVTLISVAGSTGSFTVTGAHNYSAPAKITPIR